MSPQATAVCNKVFALKDNYDIFLLIGGWHNPTLGIRTTLGCVMAEQLVKKGLDRHRIFTHFKPPGHNKNIPHLVPPRDTMVEVDCLPWYFRALGHPNPKKVKFDAVCGGIYWPRTRFLYALRGANLGKLHPAWSLSQEDHQYALQQIPGILLTAMDPRGEGRFFTKLRQKRTPAGSEKCHFAHATPIGWT
ncbi:MAG: hypothetical protein HZA80_01635 [Candidatus Taylorbacteria bacterium]|nr:hypothetical protein [Candidatus Taylorbacteria bacterium]